MCTSHITSACSRITKSLRLFCDRSCRALGFMPNTISSYKVTGVRREPRVDGVLEWSRGENGELNFESNRVTFNDWSIPYTNVLDAVVNRESILFRKTQTLAIRSEDGQFMFYFHKPTEELRDIPFEIRVTEKRSFIGKLFLLMIILFLVNLVWNLLKTQI